MNKTFKVIFSRTRGKYVVADELVKSAGKGALCAVALAVAATSVLAADKDVVDKGAQAIAYDISPQNDGTNIAIGKNAKVFIGGGTQESALSFGEAVSTSWTGSMNIHSNSAAKQNLPAGIAIGTNTYARTGSIQIGDHTLEKNKIAIGDATADKLRQFGVAATTLGTNSYTGGGFATTIGSYNVQSSPYEASGVTDTFINSTKNAFATVIGTLNSNESMAGNSSSGVANYLGGVANKVTNSNGAVVIGAGNTVKESSDYIDSSAYATHAASVTEMQQAMIDGVRQSSGGATLVFGGGNQAEYTQASQLIGVNNTLTGTSGSVSQYNALNGYKNTAENVKQTYITGIENSVYNSLQVKVLGDNNTVSKSNYQTVIGDNNSVANRDAGTTSGKNRTNPDLWIGAGNSIDGNDTYQSGYETLKTIGNHNKFVNAGSGIVIGDYQTIDAAKESVVIGSMSPDEQADETTVQKANSVVIGYHTQSGSRDSGGLNVVLGNRAKAYGWVQTVTGIGSVAGVKDDFTSGYLATSYGALNKIDGTESFANSVVGTLNKTDDAAGALVLGSGNTVSHSSLDVVAPELGQIVAVQSQYLALGDSSYLSYDTTVDIMGKMMSAGGGSVSTIGHGNTADYASLSQIFGSGNILKGAAGNISERNTISGSYNTGTDIKNTSLIGTGNTVSGSQNDVVIGDYHTLSGGGNNVVIGSMETQDQQVTKTVKAGSQDISYTVTEKVPVKPHQSNISDTVMIGHNAQTLL